MHVKKGTALTVDITFFVITIISKIPDFAFNLLKHDRANLYENLKPICDYLGHWCLYIGIYKEQFITTGHSMLDIIFSLIHIMYILIQICSNPVVCSHFRK